MISSNNNYRPANEVWGKVIFLHLSVILFTGGGKYLGRFPPGRSTPLGSTHLGRYTPLRQVPHQQVHPLGRYTPQVHPPGRYAPPTGTPPGRVHPPGGSACWEIRATSGWYASHWNAFLLTSVFKTKIVQ